MFINFWKDKNKEKEAGITHLKNQLISKLWTNFFKWAAPHLASFEFIFIILKQIIQILQQKYKKINQQVPDLTSQPLSAYVFSHNL